MKKKILLGLVLILCCFTGCSSNGSSEKDDNNPPEIKMSDIDWSVKRGIIDDERKLAFSCKNNTDYTIMYIKLTFTRKDSVSDQEMLNGFKQYENDDYSKNDIKKINIVTESYRFVKSGQKSNNISCGADDGLWTDVTQDQYTLMTPDNAIIKVIKNRKFYMFNYDFKNKDMVLDDSNSDINGHQMIWRKKLQNQIPIEISPVLRDLITVIFCYQILRNPLKTLDLSQVSFPLLFPLCYIFPYKFTNFDKGKYKGKKI